MHRHVESLSNTRSCWIDVGPQPSYSEQFSQHGRGRGLQCLTFGKSFNQSLERVKLGLRVWVTSSCHVNLGRCENMLITETSYLLVQSPSPVLQSLLLVLLLVSVSCFATCTILIIISVPRMLWLKLDIPSGNQTWQWNILYKYRFECEQHPSMVDFPAMLDETRG